MAKFLPGPMVGMISGSIGATTFSRNRYGVYSRTRAHPTIVTSPYAQAAKARLAQASQGWGGLSADQRLQWQTWAQVNPITDKLGQSQVLAGNAAFTMLNARQLQQGGAILSAPPVGSAPGGFTDLELEADIGAGDVQLTFAPDPIGANNRIWVWAAVVNSAGVQYVKNLYKLVAISNTNQASPLGLEAAIEARFGSLIAGQWVHILAQVSSNTTGLQSIGAPQVAQVVST